MNITNRKTFVFSVDCAKLVIAGTSKIRTTLDLSFDADTLVLKNISYNETTADTADVVQIVCNKTQDGIIGSFPNKSSYSTQHNEYFPLSGPFQIGAIEFEFQQTRSGSPLYFLPQAGIVTFNNAVPPVPSSNTNGTVSFTIEFLKHDKK